MNNELNEIEKVVMDMLLRGSDPVLQSLHQQYRNSVVCKRELTGVGFFVFFSVPKGTLRLSKKSFKFGDVIADINGLKNGAGFLLYIEQGVIHSLEGYTYDERWPENITSFRLSYISGKRDLISLRKVWST